MGNPEEGRDRSLAAADSPTWPQFLRSQAEAILACDFFTADLLNGARVYVLSILSLGL